MKSTLYLLLFVLIFTGSKAYSQKPAFRVVALSEDKGHHVAYSERAKVWLKELAETGHFQIDFINNTSSINEKMLSQYQLFIQLDYPPYNWSDASKAAFKNYIEQGKGGWIGFHHATLLGEFDGFPMWPWFSDFMGGIRYKNYIATFVSAKVNIEETKHPVMMGIESPFLIEKEEWYIYDKSPRTNVKVLASVDEATYSPASAIKMGDHPVVWTNEKMKARNVYIFMGHSPLLFDNAAYTKMFSNAIFWAAQKDRN